jgi:multisubunit Na+/H+ antiporter MnhC subunit
MRIASVGLTGTALLVGFVNIISIKKNELSLALLNSLLETERLVDTVPQTLMFTAGFDGLALVFVMLTLFSFPLLLVSV